ncbi:conserved hypothetical protein [Lodderomyces elongisporus NRRL YB-4239]|uniref:IMS import disulfide relay-system CHCH-CHCH-like Cx9C domain-containing protein n=1 Tax=Lodderomyces elongisporus (strain ATCC 11503 / CBS 2605 / JCM 1781 / NBRC 1676 / NRRL YB-4239) TaxID=379508 RepID=A5E3C7_LODEL|nr:conserved hypothetical protein [Lodderomyces elongisporus NRRL YB-4239]
MSEPKGGLLDQILLEDIARYCPQQFLAFHQCMSSPQSQTDPEACLAQQLELTKCIKFVVPSFQKIQTQCAGKLQSYEACLKMNKSDALKCTHELEGLRNCAFGSVKK